VGDLVSDRVVADGYARDGSGVDFSGASPVPYPLVSTVSAMSEGASLGNSYQATFDSLELVVKAKLGNVNTIAEVFAQVDAELAGGPK